MTEPNQPLEPQAAAPAANTGDGTPPAAAPTGDGDGTPPAATPPAQGAAGDGDGGGATPPAAEAPKLGPDGKPLPAADTAPKLGPDGKPLPAEPAQATQIQTLVGDLTTKLAAATTDADKAALQKKINVLSRFTTADAMIDRLISLQDQVAKGIKPTEAPGENATPEEKAAWRAANGVPEAADKYDLSNLGEGLVVGEADKPLVGKFTERMHAKNVPQGVVQEAVKVYLENVADTVAARDEADKAFEQEAEMKLHKDWGDTYPQNKNAIASLLAMAPPRITQIVAEARDHQGRLIGNDPEFIQWAAQVSRDLNPAATVVPNTVNAAQSIDDELAAIDKERNTNRDAFMKNDTLRARERQLLEAKDKMTARGG